MNIQFFYRKDNLQIDSVYRDSKTNSSVFKNEDLYEEVNVIDPPYSVSRNHRVVLNNEGDVENTVENVNPVQPMIPIDLQLYGYFGVIDSINPDNKRPLTVKINYLNNVFTRNCFVTQDIVDSYQSGNLRVGDYVLINIIENDIDKMVATQKIFKSW